MDAVQPASPATRTAGLPFMNDSSMQTPAAVQKKHETSLPVVRAVPKVEPAKPGSEIRAGIELEPSADECPVLFPKTAPKEAPAAPQAPEVKPGSATSAPAEVKPARIPGSGEIKTEKPRKSRRPLLEGSFGPYEIEGEIARGGVGAVFRARERDTGRQVALKVLLDGDEAGEAERERFRHECETAKALSLPGMVQVYSVGEIDQKPYMAMELVNGRSLDKIIPEKQLSVNDCLVLMKSVAETIGALHEAGYVHRDLKPGNILIDAFGSPKVADFGLVKSLDEITRLTASGLVCGTPAYMAPEQARGDGKAVDPRSDVWALGAVLYEMLTGQPPFQAENALRLMLKITKDQPKPPRVLNLKVPQDVQNIVLRCLEKNAEKRYANARVLSLDIARFLNGEPIEVSTQPNVQRILKAASENRRSLIVAAGGIAALVVIAVIVRLAFAPRDLSPLVDGAQKALYEKKFDVAERDLRKVIAQDAQNARAWLLLGLCLGRTGIQQQRVTDQQRVNEALAATAQAAELDPNLRAEAYAQVASFNRWQGDFKTEALELEHALEHAPNNLKYRELLGLAYWRLGAQQNSAAWYKKAVSEFRAILAVDSAYPKVGGYIQQLQEVYLAQLNTTARTTASRSRGR
ncbi:MAG TPA: protein kinase [Planctomycetota bacterium]|nr:protein kinase [Planctomycetota bacterium]